MVFDGGRVEHGARMPVAIEEADNLLLLGLGRHEHGLGRVLLLLRRLPITRLLVSRLLVLSVGTLALILVEVMVVRSLVGALLIRLVGHIEARRIGVRRAPALDRLAVHGADYDAARYDDAGRAIAAAMRQIVGQACELQPQSFVVLLKGVEAR